MKLTKTEEAILLTLVKREGGYTVKLPNARKATRDAMAKLRSRGLVVNEVRGSWSGNWLTTAGLDKAAGLTQWRRGDFHIDGVVIPVVDAVPCVALVQYGKGEPVTCSCPSCAVRNAGLTPEQIRTRMDGANS